MLTLCQKTISKIVITPVLNKRFLTSVFEMQKTPFDYTQDNYEKVDNILSKYPSEHKKSAIIPLLHLAQDQEGFVPESAMVKIASIVACPVSKVFETFTFYTMFRSKPSGDHVVEVCTNLSCQLRGADQILKAIQDKLGIKIGETTKDKKFTLLEVECQGACATAPVVVIDGHYYEDVEVKSIHSILRDFSQDVVPKSGTQSQRKGPEPMGGKTTLKTEPWAQKIRQDL
ncbi:NADH dehydrogenase ubiquinone flavoprotein [Anaeramoeba flamelloides]|uniref:NADH dehydrogenase ubiquinone flavoprotein n=1 Tax=Anaeramoeba flamelloides TaxID=1746091 RepID=A0AAV7YZA3_9EUKA|nr:NADH dehydrogenase ubiquinone flavoprotein 2 [Anaeramoeba flamelloides]KAJ6244780.1 NADH dehydrogenase ubiquinone flavoprotein [Anaeramoeba flamelloides]